jgi:hypothetical protein
MRRVAGDRRLQRTSSSGTGIIGGLQRISELSLFAGCAAKMAPFRGSRGPLSRAEGLVRNELMLVLGFCNKEKNGTASSEASAASEGVDSAWLARLWRPAIGG